jgi:uncharacterized protein
VSQPLKSEIERELSNARKARDRLRTTVLSSTLSEIRNQEIADGAPADDETVRRVLTRALKQRREAAEQMRAGGREDLAEKEDREAEILSAYLPPPLGPDEVRAIVREILAEGPAEPGPVMGRLMPRIRGRFDGKEANRIVREELGS